MAVSSTGRCYICKTELNKTAMKNHIVKTHGGEFSGQECMLLKIEGAYDKDYWLYLDLPMESDLSDLDHFLRRIWLECCGHLSAFRYPGRSGSREVSMGINMRSFAPGEKVLHEYDFGTTTESLVTVVGSILRKPQRSVVRLLARNIAPVFECALCGAVAEHICTQCMYSSANPFYCEECAEKHDHNDMFLPVVNSPRMGQCGYEGEQDLY